MFTPCSEDDDVHFLNILLLTLDMRMLPHVLENSLLYQKVTGGNISIIVADRLLTHCEPWKEGSMPFG